MVLWLALTNRIILIELERMDSASLTSLTPLLDDVDRWRELAPLLPVLVALELVLSADNAVALAAIARRQHNPRLQSLSLNIGISIALVFRILLILTAQWVLDFWPLQLLAGIYLLCLSINKFINFNFSSSTIENLDANKKPSLSLLRTVLLLSITDLAFSIDSVAAAVAISDQFLLVVTGAIIGVIALRLTSALFIKWLQIYSNLETAGYIAVGLIGTKLIIELIIPNLVIQEWIIFIIITLLFLWGFSRKIEAPVSS